MNLNATIRRLIRQSAVYTLIPLIPGHVTGNAYDALVKRIFRNQKGLILATWPQ